MHFQHRWSFTDESEGFLSQYLVYLQAYQIEPPGFHFLPEYKPGQFSKSPKIWFPNVKFFDFSIPWFHSRSLWSKARFDIHDNTQYMEI